MTSPEEEWFSYQYPDGEPVHWTKDIPSCILYELKKALELDGDLDGDATISLHLDVYQEMDRRGIDRKVGPVKGVHVEP